jgi:hypothetical protein
MNKIDLWFGDSFVVGSELAELVGDYTLGAFDIHPHCRPYRDRPDLAFPHIVSTARQTPYINFGRGGSSIEFQLQQLTNYCKNNIIKDKEYTAFFCLPFQSRGFFIDKEGQHQHVRLSEKTTQIEIAANNYRTTILTNHLYLLSKEYGITPWFMSIVTIIELDDSLDIIPKECWFIPKDSCLVNEALDLNIEKHIHYVDLMRTENSLFQKYVYPCELHFNLVGNETISNFILRQLKVSQPI